MITLHEAQENYINRWRNNAEQHFRNGDYDWVASLVEKSGAKRILEIGCGVGLSTLALANRGIQALSIDPIPEAIEDTKQLLMEYGISVGILGEEGKPGMLLKQIDAIDNFDEVSKYIQWIDLVLICNPGGKMEANLTEREIEMLHWGHYSDEQMKEEKTQALHKWAILIAAARLAKENGKQLIVVDRGSPEELDSVLNAISDYTCMNGQGRSWRRIQPPPKNGIQLDGSEFEMYWGAGWLKP